MSKAEPILCDCLSKTMASNEVSAKHCSLTFSVQRKRGIQHNSVDSYLHNTLPEVCREAKALYEIYLLLVYSE